MEEGKEAGVWLPQTDGASWHTQWGAASFLREAERSAEGRSWLCPFTGWSERLAAIAAMREGNAQVCSWVSPGMMCFKQDRVSGRQAVSVNIPFPAEKARLTILGDRLSG